MTTMIPMKKRASWYPQDVRSEPGISGVEGKSLQQACHSNKCGSLTVLSSDIEGGISPYNVRIQTFDIIPPAFRNFTMSNKYARIKQSWTQDHKK